MVITEDICLLDVTKYTYVLVLLLVLTQSEGMLHFFVIHCTNPKESQQLCRQTISTQTIVRVPIYIGFSYLRIHDEVSTNQGFDEET